MMSSCAFLTVQLVVISLVIVKATGSEQTKSPCVTNQTNMTCNFFIPDVIPKHVQNVRILQLEKTIRSDDFENDSWQRVVSLDIETNKEFDARTNVFADLKTLRRLGLHLKDNINATETLFQGLDQLKELDLSGSPHWFWGQGESYLETVLNVTNILPNLETLNLVDVGTGGDRGFRINNDFVLMVINKSIQNLILGNQTFDVHIDLPALSASIDAIGLVPSALQSVHVSNMGVAVSLPGTHNWFMYALEAVIVLKNFTELTLSDITMNRPFDSRYTLCKEDVEFKLTAMLWLVEANFLNIRFVHTDLTTTIDAGICDNVFRIFRLKRLRIKKCKLTTLDITFIVPDNSSLEEFDFSNNRLSYFSLNLTGTLKKLNLGCNRLCEMLTNPKFPGVFQNFTALEYLDISENGFESLPYHIFSRNLELKSILLRGNYLTSISFRINHLRNLQLIDLRFNKIKMLDSNTMDLIDEMVAERGTTFDLRENKFDCSCEAKEFIKWIPGLYNESHAYQCRLDENLIYITPSTYIECEKLCNRDFMYVCIGMFCLFFSTFVLCLVFGFKRKWNRDKFQANKKLFIKRFKKQMIFAEANGDTRQIKFIAVLVYHENDYVTCRDHFFTPLNSCLQQVLDTQTDVILFGLENESPGHSRNEELEIRASISCVFVCLVTADFCFDYWCQAELENADREGKPIILLLIGEVEHYIPLFLKRISKRAYKASLSKEGLKENILNSTCDKIIKLAVDSYTKKTSDTEREAMLPCVENQTRRTAIEIGYETIN